MKLLGLVLTLLISTACSKSQEFQFDQGVTVASGFWAGCTGQVVNISSVGYFTQYYVRIEACPHSDNRLIETLIWFSPENLVVKGN